MSCESEGQAQSGGKLGAIRGRPEDPDRHLRSRSRDGANLLFRRGGPQQAPPFLDILSKALAPAGAPDGRFASFVGARRTPKPKVNPSRVESIQSAELLRNHERRVVRQHDASRSDTNGLRRRCKLPD